MVFGRPPSAVLRDHGIGEEKRKKGGCEVAVGRLNQEDVMKVRKGGRLRTVHWLTWDRRAPVHYRQKDKERGVEGYSDCYGALFIDLDSLIRRRTSDPGPQVLPRLL